MWPKSYFGHDKSSVMNQYQVVDPKMLIWPAGFNDEIYILNRLIKSFNLSFIKQKKTVPWSWFNVSMPILFRTVFVRIIPHRLTQPITRSYHRSRLSQRILLIQVRFIWKIILNWLIGHPRTVTARDCNNRSAELTNNINGFDRKQFNAKLQIILQKHSILIGFIPNWKGIFHDYQA